MIRKFNILFVLTIFVLLLTGCYVYPKVTETNVLAQFPEIIAIMDTLHKVSGDELYELQEDESFTEYNSANDDFDDRINLNVYVPHDIEMNTVNRHGDGPGGSTSFQGLRADASKQGGYWYGQAMEDPVCLGVSGFYQWYVVYHFEEHRNYPDSIGNFLCTKTINDIDVDLFVKKGEMGGPVGVPKLSIFGKFNLEGKEYLLSVNYLYPPE